MATKAVKPFIMAITTRQLNKHYRKFDVVKLSKPLKVAAQRRIDAYGIDKKRLCEIAGVNFNQFSMWLNSNNPYKYDDRLLVQADIIEICRILGIEIRLTIILNEPDKFDDYIFSETKT